MKFPDAAFIKCDFAGFRSARVTNFLFYSRRRYLGDVARMSEKELLNERGVGRLTVREIKRGLKIHGLNLGMVIPGWPPENVEELSRRLEGGVY